jgi:hypothetical protein
MKRFMFLMLAAVLAAGCGESGGVTKPGTVANAPDKSDPGLKGESLGGPP